ncbi:MAG: hypothetical protein HYR97_04195, partial [Candidatus Melainabacteria bacterium]|nr:hypothetical protein [Candidatus Melainabacteria bacterium]
NRRIIQDINALIEAELSTVAIFISGFNDVARGGELSDFVNTLIDVNTDINNHLEILNNIGDEIQQAEADGEILPGDATDLLKKVTCAIKSDSNAQKKAKVVREEFEELIDRGAEPIGFSRSDRSRIVRRILAANRCKEGIINIIAKLEEKDD